MDLGALSPKRGVSGLNSASLNLHYPFPLSYLYPDRSRCPNYVQYVTNA